MLKGKKVATVFLALVALLGLSTGAHATAIDWDQILYKLNTIANGGIPLANASNLDATIDMTFNSGTGLLTVTLRNTSGNTTGSTPSAANFLTGVGFNLPTGVTIIDDVAHNSMIALAGSSQVLSGTLTQDRWGWRLDDTPGGHYNPDTYPGVLPVNFILSTMFADSDRTFGGQNASNALLDSTDYGLISSTGSSPNPGNGYIVDGLMFSIYLNMGSYSGDLIQYIQNGNVVVEYGSPADLQGHRTPPPVPEPASMLLMGAGLMTWGVVHRRRRQKRAQ